MNIKEELIEEFFPDLDLEVQEETETGNEHPPNSVTQNVSANSQFVNQNGSNVEMVSGDYPPNQLTQEEIYMQNTNSQFVNQNACNVGVASGDDPSTPLSHENYLQNSNSLFVNQNVPNIEMVSANDPSNQLTHENNVQNTNSQFVNQNSSNVAVASGDDPSNSLSLENSQFVTGDYPSIQLSHENSVRNTNSQFVNQNSSNVGVASGENPSNTLSLENSQFVNQNASNVGVASGDDPANTLSHKNSQFVNQNFQSVKVHRESRTPYTDATNVPHDAQKPKRPMNAFMIFAHHERKKILQGEASKHNAIISRDLGKRWKLMTSEERAPYKNEAERLRQFHLIQYPDYKYQPKKKAKQTESFLTRRNLPFQSQFALARSGQCSYKINNIFGSNYWINKPVAELCNGRTELLDVDMSKFGRSLVIDSNFKKTLKKVPVKSSSPSTSTSSYHSPEISSASNASLPSSDTSSLNQVQNSSSKLAYDVDKSDIADIIEEFMGETSTPSPSTISYHNSLLGTEKSSYHNSVPSPFYYVTPPSNTNPQPHLQHQQQEQQQQFYNKLFQSKLYQQKVYLQQQQHQDQLLWQHQQFRYQNPQPNGTIY